MKLLSLLAFAFIAIHAQAQSNIVITEIMYNQPGNDTLEYVEIYNKGASPVVLDGYTFTQGFDYTFSSYTLNAGAYVVLCKYKNFVDNFYSINSIQWTSGDLNNAGEKIVLKDPLGNIVDSVEYEDSQPWDTHPDGNGSSLILCDPNQNNALGYNWTASSELKGFFPPGPGGVIIYGNPGAGNTSCSPPGEIFPPKVKKADVVSQSVIKIKYSEPVSLSSAQNISNYTGIGTISSAIRTSLDSVTLTLFSPLPIGFVDTLYISNISDTSGNAMTSSKMEIIVFNNTIADLIFTEILYNPPGKDTLEFIEVYNHGSTAATVGGYKFTDGIDFMFPDITISPGEYKVIARYPVLFNAFFGTSVNLQFDNALNNGGEKITLKNTVGDVIDSLTFLPAWNPVTDQGPSLVLCDVDQNNNIGSNWGASGTFAGTYESNQIYASPGTANTDCNVLGLTHSQKASFSVYPNPSVNGLIKIEFMEASERVIKLLNLKGEEILSQESTGEKTEMIVSRGNSGLYYLQIFDLKKNTYESRPVLIVER